MLNTKGPPSLEGSPPVAFPKMDSGHLNLQDKGREIVSQEPQKIFPSVFKYIKYLHDNLRIK